MAATKYRGGTYDKASMGATKYKVIRDTREQERGDGWRWPESDLCAGTEVRTLKTGDYTLETFEEDFVIERKSGTAELAKNITEGRFERELERMGAFKYPFLIIEATWDDVLHFPANSGIPESRWPRLRVTNHYMVKRICEFQLRYKTKFIFAGKEHAKAIASSLFKRIIEARHASEKAA